MPDLSLQQKALRLRIYIGESDRWRNKQLDVALLETLRAHQVAGATVFRGAAGFGAHSHIHTSAIEVLSMDLPIVIEVIDTPEQMKAVLDIIYPMVREGLITLEEVQIVKYTHRFLNPLPADRLVAEVMTQNVASVTMETPVHQAWKQMLDQSMKALPVVDNKGTVVGILTDEDLLERAGIQQRLSIAIRMDKGERDQELRMLENSKLTVTDVMTHPAVTVHENDTLAEATTRMVKAGLKRLPVVDRSGKLVGVLSRLDVLRQVAHASPVSKPEQLRPHAIQTVADIMTTHIPMVGQDDDLATIIDKFAKSDSNRLIVVDSDEKAVGLISDSDVVARVQPAKRKNIIDALRQIGKPALGTETAYQLMSAGPLTARPDLTVVDAVNKMLSESRKWLVVIDENGRPLGLVDRQILLEAVASIYHVE